MIDALKHILESIAFSREHLSQADLQSLAEAARLRQAADDLLKKYGGLDLAPPRDAARINNWLRAAGALEAHVQASRQLVAALEERIGRQHDLLTKRFAIPELESALKLMDCLEGAALTPTEIESLPTTIPL